MFKGTVLTMENKITEIRKEIDRLDIDDNARRSIKVENLYLLDAIVNEMNH